MVIGKQGANIEKVQNLPGVISVEITDRTTGKVYVEAQTQEALENALALVDLQCANMHIPKDFVGLVIGREGRTMQELQDSSEVHMLRFRRTPDDEHEDVLEMIGSRKGIEKVAVAVNFLLHSMDSFIKDHGELDIPHTYADVAVAARPYRSSPAVSDAAPWRQDRRPRQDRRSRPAAAMPSRESNAASTRRIVMLKPTSAGDAASQRPSGNGEEDEEQVPEAEADEDSAAGHAADKGDADDGDDASPAAAVQDLRQLIRGGPATGPPASLESNDAVGDPRRRQLPYGGDASADARLQQNDHSASAGTADAGADRTAPGAGGDVADDHDGASARMTTDRSARGQGHMTRGRRGNRRHPAPRGGNDTGRRGGGRRGGHANAGDARQPVASTAATADAPSDGGHAIQGADAHGGEPAAAPADKATDAGSTVGADHAETPAPTGASGERPAQPAADGASSASP